jgi:O-antigen/teichoic acid export membrane protein
MSFFWVTGIIQSFLPLCKNNKTFSGTKAENARSVEIFNTFVLLLGLSILFIIFGFVFQESLKIFNGGQEIRHFKLLVLYFLFSNPACLVEYIYLIRNQPGHILGYGMLSFGLQLLFVTIPIIFGWPIQYAIWGLVLISMFRFIWLIRLLLRHACFKFSWSFLKEHLSLAVPLIISTLLSGSAQYIDGIIISLKYDAERFALYRYGAKELPFVAMLANGLNGAMLQEFTTRLKVRESLQIIKQRSRKLMHILFPLSMFFLLFSDWIFPRLFNSQFTRSSDVFMVYILLIISRLVFPQTILIGMKETKPLMRASLISITLNISISLWFIPFYGIVGSALATLIAYTVEKIALVGYTYFKLQIDPRRYIPLGWYFFYTTLLTMIFVAIDHRWIVIR